MEKKKGGRRGKGKDASVSLFFVLGGSRTRSSTTYRIGFFLLSPLSREDGKVQVGLTSDPPENGIVLDPEVDDEIQSSTFLRENLIEEHPLVERSREAVQDPVRGVQRCESVECDLEHDLVLRRSGRRGEGGEGGEERL